MFEPYHNMLMLWGLCLPSPDPPLIHHLLEYPVLVSSLLTYSALQTELPRECWVPQLK